MSQPSQAVLPADDDTAEVAPPMGATIDARAIAATLPRSDELRPLLVDAWRMCVPKKVAAAYVG